MNLKSVQALETNKMYKKLVTMARTKVSMNIFHDPRFDGMLYSLIGGIYAYSIKKYTQSKRSNNKKLYSFRTIEF